MTDTQAEDRILNKVQKLLDKAWSTTFDEERKSLLAKADALMIKYTIDSMLLQDPNRPNTAKPIAGQEPELRTMSYYESDRYWDIEYEVRQAMLDLFVALAKHLGCRSTGYSQGSCKVVGYPTDLEFLDMMYLTLKLDFMKRVDPQVSSQMSWTDNLLAFKQAGFKWEDIHEKMRFGLADYPYSGMAWERKMGVRFTGIYKKWRDENPDEPANLSSPKLWREDFILGYTSRIGQRLIEMREATVKSDDNLPALIDDKNKKVNDAFLSFFPPQPPPKVTSNGKPVRYRQPKLRAVSMQARQAGAAAANRADLNQRNSRVGRGSAGELG